MKALQQGWQKEGGLNIDLIVSTNIHHLLPGIPSSTEDRHRADVAMSQSCLCSGREGLRVAENISLGEKMSEGCSTQNNHWNNFQIGFRCYTSCDCPSFGSPSSEHVFQKLTKINPRNFSLSPITRLAVGSISPFKKMCLSKRRETVHLSRACNKLCKKFNPHRFAALRNCSWVSVANDSLP